MRRGRYTKGKRIGKGSFGTCFLGTNDATGETVVIKNVELRGLSNKDLKMSKAEVAVLQKLEHPYIVGYRDSYKEDADGVLCIVMEYAAGGDLGSLIHKREKARSHFTENEVRKILAQCVDALAYCHHTCHLLHRDLKPDNVFLSAAGDIKIGDFGISRSLTSTNAMARTQCGTPLFMSPELAAGKAYDTGADVWALGCVLYSLMTLKQPWADRVGPKGGMMELMRLISSSSLDLAPVRARYSAELCSTLSSMLAKSASARPSFKSLLATPLVQTGLALAPIGVPPKLPKPPTPADGARLAAAMPAAGAAAPAAQRPKVAPSPPPQKCRPPLYSQAYGEHTPATLTFGIAPDILPPKPPSAKPAARTKPAAASAQHAEARNGRGRSPAVGAAGGADMAFGSDTHAAAAAVQRSFRRKKLVHAKAPVHKPHAGAVAQNAEAARAAAMAKIDGLLGEVRAIRGEVPAPPPAPPRPLAVQQRANALAAQRKDISEQRMREEEALRRQREQYEALDAERAAERAALKAQREKRR